ncbi:DUF1800 domain-containing protein [Jannaschia sp. Os4]|uniref:DUF1800 domain-containing protein n=1 Tax=Jannaschia sp. Os4 TaxID=2807617 RepID=UPI00193A6CC8|nr:DUF1800 domain-containing protein [Jannaschia sp. Os4]MBM2575063.1 DUF1800 domain-containing protein [Jannaschia sp. Os4]
MTPRAALAATRFGTGLSPVIPPPSDADDLLAALAGPDAVARALPHPGWDVRAAAALERDALRRQQRDGVAGAFEAFRAQTRRLNVTWQDDLVRMVLRGATTADGLRERLVWFWADHFTVASSRGASRMAMGGYHEDALRPRVAGRFADLLIAAVTHPAMLIYLDQVVSVGPNSRRGRNGRGLNENLAREVLELHTLGAGGPYAQADVRQLAELLTGLRVDRRGRLDFEPERAEPGAETVLGRSYGDRDPGIDEVRAVLSDLSIHPATASHICRKLAGHFLADVPPAGAVAAMEAAWRATDGDLMAVYAAMLDHPAAWAPERAKMRRPLEMIAAGLRALGRDDALLRADAQTKRRVVTRPMLQMGQDLPRPPGPQGWPDEAVAWATPQNFAARLDWALRAPGWTGEVPDPRAFAEAALGPLLADRTRFAAGAAESREEGVALVLTSPEFQRR